MSSTPSHNDPKLQPSRWRRAIPVVGILVLIAAIVGGVIFFSAPQQMASITFDNDSDEPLKVRVEGVDVLVVEPRSHARWNIAAGRHRLMLIVGLKTVFDHEKDL